MTARPDRLTWLGHSTAVIDLDGARLVTDPVLRARVGHLRRMVAPAGAPGAVDAALISHLHLDHLHGPSLRRLAAATIVAPRGARRLLRRRAARIEEVAEGDEVAVGPTPRAGGARRPRRAADARPAGGPPPSATS